MHRSPYHLKRKTDPTRGADFHLSCVARNLCVLERRFVRYGQLLATLGTTCSQYLTTLGRSHALTESVFVDPFPTRRLVGSLHCHSYTLFLLFFPLFPLFLSPPLGRRTANLPNALAVKSCGSNRQIIGLQKYNKKINRKKFSRKNSLKAEKT